MKFREFLRDHPKVRMFIEQNHSMLPYLVYLARGGKSTAEIFNGDFNAYRYWNYCNRHSRDIDHLSDDEIERLSKSDYWVRYNPAFLHYPVSPEGPPLVFSLDRALTQRDWEQVLDAMCGRDEQKYFVGLTIYSWLYPRTSVQWFMKKYDRFHSDYCMWRLANPEIFENAASYSNVVFCRDDYIRTASYNMACGQISAAMGMSQRRTKMLYAAYEMVQ